MHNLFLMGDNAAWKTIAHLASASAERSHSTMDFPSKWVAHCHCKNCQRTHGAAFVTWVSAEELRVAILDSDELLRWYASSSEADRGFCSHCGSSLFFRSVKWPGELHIARANFVDPIDRQPQVHGYYDTHVEWFTVVDDLPKKGDPDK